MTTGRLALAPEPYFAKGGVTLYHGDCLTIMPLLAEPVDLVLADPPYGTTRNQWDRELPNKLLWSCYHQLARPTTPLLLFASGSFGARVIVENLAEYRYDLIWEKDQVSGWLNARRQPLRSHEQILVFYERPPLYVPQMVDTGRKSHSRGSKIDRTTHHYGTHYNTPVPEGQQGQYPRSVLRFPRPKEGLHPSQKPVELCRWLIRTYTKPGDLVLDNVAGSATTLAAAAEEGRRAIGIEIHEPYAEVSARRLEALL